MITPSLIVCKQRIFDFYVLHKDFLLSVNKEYLTYMCYIKAKDLNHVRLARVTLMARWPDYEGTVNWSSTIPGMMWVCRSLSYFLISHE